MKYLIDLKIYDTVWIVQGLNIFDQKIDKLSTTVIYINNGTEYNIEENTSHIAHRIIGKNSDLCLTLEDACLMAKINAFGKIKKHIKIIKEKGGAIDAIGLRINELDDLQHE
jgi:hypothetical protein